MYRQYGLMLKIEFYASKNPNIRNLNVHTVLATHYRILSCCPLYHTDVIGGQIWHFFLRRVYTCDHVWKIYFSTNFLYLGKLANQPRTIGRCVKIINDIRKSSCGQGREQNFRQTLYQLCQGHPLCLSKKPTGDGSQWAVSKPRTAGYTLFANYNKTWTKRKFWQRKL